MTIDEAIAHAREVASRKFDDRVHCIRCAEEHEQLAEWLEELKAYREKKCNKSVYLVNKSIDMIDAVNKGYADGYNKAIDDFVDNCSEYYFNVDDSPSSPYLRNINIISQPNIKRIAEQLKEKI